MTDTSRRHGSGQAPRVTRWRRRPDIVEGIEWAGGNHDDIRAFAVAGDGAECARWRSGGALELWNNEERTWIPCPVGHVAMRGLLGEYYPVSPAAITRAFTGDREGEAPAEPDRARHALQVILRTIVELDETGPVADAIQAEALRGLGEPVVPGALPDAGLRTELDWAINAVARLRDQLRQAQSLLEDADGDIATALGAARKALRAILAKAPPGRADSPEACDAIRTTALEGLGEAAAAQDTPAGAADAEAALREQLTAVLALFTRGGDGFRARLSGVSLLREYKRASLPAPEDLKYLGST